MFTYLFGGFGGRRDIFLTVSASQADYDLFVDAGSPNDPVNVFVTVESATVLYGSTTSLPGFKTGTGWLANTELTLINEGHILGMGGDGGDGASQVYTGQSDCGNTTDGTDGGAGGDAVDLEWDITIDNTSGNIWGGGGAGGNLTTVSSGGIGGTASGGIGANHSGCDGFPGSGGASGIGGLMGWTDQLASCPAGLPESEAGPYGEDGTNVDNSGLCTNGGAPGLAGKAIELGGYTVTWGGGSGSPNVKGAVS